MNNFKNLTKLCFLIVVIFEISAVISNISDGYPPFYLFDLSNRFSTDSSGHFIYLFSVLGIFFILADALNKFENKTQHNETTSNTNLGDRTEKVDAMLENSNLCGGIILGGTVFSLYVTIVWTITIGYESYGWIIIPIIIVINLMLIGLIHNILEFLYKKRFIS